MNTNVENPFNDNGAKDDPPFKKKFLAQRKWIILFATATALLDQSYLSLVGSVGAINISIDGEDTKLICAISAAGLLFFLYMLLTSYAYIIKYNIEKREQFSALQIEDRDTYTERIESLSAQAQQLETEIQQKREQSDSRERLWQVTINEVNSILEQFPDIADYKTESSSPGNAFAQIRELSERVKNPGYELVGNAFAPDNLTKDAASRRFNEAIKRLATIDSMRDETKEALNKLEADLATLQSESLISEAARAEVTSNNKRRWKIFHRTNVAADLTSFVPTVIAAAVCASYLASHVDVWWPFSASMETKADVIAKPISPPLEN